MSLFSEYIRVVIGAAVICGMVTLLVPKGHYEKAFRLITGVFLLFCMVTPVSRGLGSLKDFDFSVDFEDVPALEEGAWGQSAMVMEQQLKNRIGECVRTIIGEDALGNRRHGLVYERTVLRRRGDDHGRAPNTRGSSPPYAIT